MKFRDPSCPMWMEALKMLEQAEQLHKHFFQLGQTSSRGPIWETPVDLLETERDFSILVALPGVASSEVTVVIEDNVIHIVGERPVRISPDTVIRRLEIPYGRFEKSIRLPSGRYQIVENTLSNGCLRLVLNKLG